MKPIVRKFGTFFVVYCPKCGRHSNAESWQESEHLRDQHECEREAVLRIDFVPPQFVREPIGV